MKGKIKSTDIGKVKLVDDSLPSPEELALKDETVKVTISQQGQRGLFPSESIEGYLRLQVSRPLVSW